MLKSANHLSRFATPSMKVNMIFMQDRLGRGGLDSARQVMIGVSEYKHNAQECRKQAQGMLRPEDKDTLERIAQIWERLANLRKRHPQLELEPENST